MSIKDTIGYIERHGKEFLERMKTAMEQQPKWQYTVCYYAEGGRLMYESKPLGDYPSDNTVDDIHSKISAPVRDLIVRAQVQKYRYYK